MRSTGSRTPPERITTYADLQRANTGELRQIIAVGGARPPSSLESCPTDPPARQGAAHPLDQDGFRISIALVA